MTLRLDRILAVMAITALSACAQLPQFSSTPSPPLPTTDRAVFTQTGVASWYGKTHHGRTTANGEKFDMEALTAAHRTLPFGTIVKVTNLSNNRSVNVRINDRGPYVAGRIIDLSSRAARELGIAENGVARVRIEQLPPAPPTS
jgi:rare lipoprotein A